MEHCSSSSHQAVLLDPSLYSQALDQLHASNLVLHDSNQALVREQGRMVQRLGRMEADLEHIRCFSSDILFLVLQYVTLSPVEHHDPSKLLQNKVNPLIYALLQESTTININKYAIYAYTHGLVTRSGPST